jgi:hypothetical protein
MDVQNIKSVPPHIDNFIQGNLTKLNEIYDEGIKVFGDGLLSFKCQQSENKIDVKFMCEEEVINSLTQDTWEQVKISRNGKKLFLIEDFDIKSMFFVYI